MKVTAPEGSSRLLTYEDVAEMLGVSKATVERLARQGKIRKTRIESMVRFRPEDVALYIASVRV